MEQYEIEIGNLQCQLCLNFCEVLEQFECIEEQYKICQDCGQVLKITTDWTDLPLFLYGQQIMVSQSSPKYYKVLFLKCGICFEKKICCKICMSDHFFCLDCSKSYFNASLNNRITKCPEIDCQQEIDHYIISLFVSIQKITKWVILNQTLFCQKKYCQNEIYFSPYKNIQTQIIRIDQDYSECKFCKTKHCNNCWVQFNGDYSQHQNICTSEKYRNQLLQQYLVNNSVFQCPKCKWYSEKDCHLQQFQIQQCYVCRTKICLICKSDDQQLFSSFHIYDNKCHICTKRLQREQQIKKMKNVISRIIFPFQFLFLLIILLLFVLLAPLHMFFEFCSFSTRCIKRKWKKSLNNFKYKLCLHILLFPFIILFVIVGEFFIYAAFILPSLFKLFFGHLFIPTRQVRQRRYQQ